MSTNAVCNCASFDWGRVDFLLSSWYGAMFRIFDESSVDNFRDVLVTAQQCLHQRQGLFWFSPHSYNKEGNTRSSRGHRRDSRLQLTQGKSCTFLCHAWHMKLGEEEGLGQGREHLKWWFLSSQITITHDELSWDWQNTCLPWKVENEVHVSLCSYAWLLLSWLNCLCFNPSVF